MPKPPSTANHGLVLKIPKRLKNSPTNPLVKGSPIPPRIIMQKIVAYIGIILARPPNLAISFVCVLS